jgi:nitrate/nitrite transporter NarK
MNTAPATPRPNLQLALGTVSFAICFAAWGLISAFAPRFRETFHLTATQTAFLVAVPVLLGALLRIATGMLADRFGGRAVFALLMILVAVPAYLLPLVPSYDKLLYVALFLGIAGSSFAVGVGFVSRWFPTISACWTFPRNSGAPSMLAKTSLGATTSLSSATSSGSSTSLLTLRLSAAPSA